MSKVPEQLVFLPVRPAFLPAFLPACLRSFLSLPSFLRSFSGIGRKEGNEM
jgi:hypothetical protein